MKSIYRGWVIVLGVLLVGLAAVLLLSPKWHSSDPVQETMEKLASEQLAQGPPAEPGQGKVSYNLSRALRLDLPVLALFVIPPAPPEHDEAENPREQERLKEELAEYEAMLDVLAQLARDYEGALSVVVLEPSYAPATFVRSKVRELPTTIIYHANNRELWRRAGPITAAQLRSQLARLNIRPAKPGLVKAK